MRHKNFFLGIAGNIGAGKTLLTTELSERTGWHAYFEPVIDNPYLDDFYADMKRWSFHLQIFFLSKRFQAQKKMLEAEVSFIQDRTIYEDAEVFAWTLNRLGHLGDRDYANYKALFDTMLEFIRPPDLIIFLKAKPESLLERIKHRGRESEKAITLDYLKILDEAYAEWLVRAQKLTEVHPIDTDKVNLLTESHKIDEIVEFVRRHDCVSAETLVGCEDVPGTRRGEDSSDDKA
ncbi:MAG: deoxynucleoside kinase [Candidatus Eiseniibacteriota bacterium]|nr:MAG: deoxynucleoside kinase [Candidatus Eisenbacteria bacterium]